MDQVKVTLAKSLISCKKNQIATAKSLGLQRPGDTTVQNNDACVLGKVKVVAHLVKVENV